MAWHPCQAFGRIPPHPCNDHSLCGLASVPSLRANTAASLRRSFALWLGIHAKPWGEYRRILAAIIRFVAWLICCGGVIIGLSAGDISTGTPMSL